MSEMPAGPAVSEEIIPARESGPKVDLLGEEPPSTVNPSGLTRGQATLAILLSVLASLALLSPWAMNRYYRVTGPPVPRPDLTGVDPQVIRAVVWSSENVSLNPGSAEAWGMLGKVLHAHAIDQEGAACFRRAEELAPKDPRWPYLLARAVAPLDPEEAADALRRAIPLCGDVPAPRLKLAELLITSGRMEEAEPLCAHVLVKQADNARALRLMGQIELGRNRLKKSLELLQRSARISPRARPTHALLAQVYRRLGDTKAADEEVSLVAYLSNVWYEADPYEDEVNAVWVGEKAQSKIATDLWNTGQNAEAILRFQNVVKEYPNSANAHITLAKRLCQADRFGEAEATAREAIKLRPDLASTHFWMAFALMQQGRASEAVDEFRETIRLQPDDGVSYYNLSYGLLARGDRKGAIEALRSAVRFKPDSAEAFRRLGRLLNEDGQTEGAREAFQTALRLAPEDAQSQKLLGRLAERPDNPDSP